MTKRQIFTAFVTRMLNINKNRQKEIQYPGSGSNRYDIAITGVWDQRVYQFRHPGIIRLCLSSTVFLVSIAKYGNDILTIIDKFNF